MVQGPCKSTPVISILGRSGSGKTRVIESLVSILAGWGWRIATVKHSNKNSNLDMEGKDTWRHRRAGAKGVVFVSPEELVVFKRPSGELNIREIRDCYLFDVDLILVEGWRESQCTKIVVCSEGDCFDSLENSVDQVWAIIGTEHCTCNSKVHFFTMRDMLELAFLIEREFLIRGATGDK
ncbi:MAG: molybdopterin-guanine dinucleotide biosynthesis protein B [Syntrophales bacterium]|nr:molybdopterin-guanine dinucleotide biosynthesis protein B [Syntrophales bacterium]